MDNVILHYDTLPHVILPAPSIAQSAHILRVQGHAAGSSVEVHPELIQAFLVGLMKLGRARKVIKTWCCDIARLNLLTSNDPRKALLQGKLYTVLSSAQLSLRRLRNFLQS